MHTKESLIAFTERVKQAFRDKRIRAPVHLCGGNEDELIGLFKTVKPTDWVFSTWRSSYHALLKGIPEEWVFDEILAGRSICLMNREHRFFCSSIVGGILPIAAGVAMTGEQVHVFVGDMTATTGLFYEFLAFCDGRKLPVRVVIDDNGYSTDSPTAEVWGGESQCSTSFVKLERYKYQRTYPHVGIGEHVKF